MTAPIITAQIASRFELQGAMLLGSLGFALAACVWFLLPETIRSQVRH